MSETSGLSLINIIAEPFQYTRKDRLKKNEIIFFLAFDIKWMNMEQANIILKRALDKGLIGYDRGMIAPKFDIQFVEDPFGFKSPQPVFKENDPVQSLKSALDEYLVDMIGSIPIPNKNPTSLISPMQHLSYPCPPPGRPSSSSSAARSTTCMPSRTSSPCKIGNALK